MISNGDAVGTDGKGVGKRSKGKTVLVSKMIELASLARS